jgi:uncharacterized protein YuzE
MRIQYFQDTDTLHIEFRPTEVAETRDLDEATLIDIDKNGAICGITVEHASERAEIPKFSYEQTAA